MELQIIQFKDGRYGIRRKMKRKFFLYRRWEYRSNYNNIWFEDYKKYYHGVTFKDYKEIYKIYESITTEKFESYNEDRVVEKKEKLSKNKQRVIVEITFD